MSWRYVGEVAALSLMGLCGCTGSTNATSSHTTGPVDDPHLPAVSVASPFLMAVVRDLAGAELPLLALAQPGMCPGHFDLRPSQVRQARHCRLLLRFDFQQSLDARVTGAGSRPPTIVAIRVTGGLCEPASYLDAMGQVAEVLVREGLVARAQAAARLAAARQRMEALSVWAHGQIETAGLARAPVMASRHQADFCRWLGLHVVATFPTADTTVPSEINDAVTQGQDAGIRWIIANLPEGRQAADALADHFSATVVIFGNFPDGQGTDSFDRLVRENVTALVKALQP